MNKQETQAVQELYNLLHQWKEKYTVGWVDRSDFFKRFYRGVKHLVKCLQVLTDTEYLPCQTVEEKVANAVFYVEGGVTYTIEYSMLEEGYFTVSSLDDQSGDIEIKIDSIPADAYFLGTVRL